MYVGAVVAFLLAFLPASATANSQQFCTAFNGMGSTVVVSKMTKNPTCAVAAGITRDFLTRRGVTRHGGPSNAQTWYTLKRYPGWRCGTGAGGGGCRKASRQIGWEITPGRIPLTPVVDDRDVFRVKPVRWVPDRTPRLGLGVGFYSLKWTGWGKPVASATGEIRICVQYDCTSHRGRIEVRNPGYSQEKNRILYRCLRFVSVPDVPEINRSWATISGNMSDRCPA